ncbi:MAG: SPFH domain-containing protein [Caldisericia bacterium]|nr:SPFH domain-containing protein [Caldisericia bacterium]
MQIVTIFIVFLVLMVIISLFKKEVNRTVGAKVLPAILTGVFVLAILFSMFAQVPAGHMGLVYQFGAIRGVRMDGLQFKAPWQSIIPVNIQTQKQAYQNIVCFSQETQEVFVNGTVNFYIESTNIRKLYENVGKLYVQKLIDPRVMQEVKNQTVKYTAVDIAPNREQIRKAVKETLMNDPELKDNSIIITDFLLENIDFHDEFKNAIEAKQVATQEALRAAEQIKIEKAKADQAIETARGVAQSEFTKKKAEGDWILYIGQKQAEANALLNKTLTSELIQLKMIEKLSDKLQIMIVPSGSVNFFDPKSLLSQLTSATAK